MRALPPILLLAAAWACGREPQPAQSLGPEAGSAALAAVSYDVVKIPTSLGGTQSRGMAINASGLVAGWSNTSTGHRHAVIWRNGVIENLGTLGGPSSTVPWPGLNDAGLVVGISHTDRPDTLHEDWSCDLGSFLPETTDLICSGFVYENGQMRELPTLGGNHGFAAGVNNRGQIVGWAETAVVDSTCTDAQVLGFRAVLWEPKSGQSDRIKTTELPPLGEDAASAATAINDDGVAVGISGDCDQSVGRFSARHAVLWDKNHKPVELPNLGGTTWHTPMDINQAGDVVGFSNPAAPGDPQGDFLGRPFFWANGEDSATPIGTLRDDAVGEAFAINARRQVVGISFGGSGPPHAFLWQNGVLIDLNEITDVAPDILLSAQDINDAGQITGRVLDAATGQVFMFIATPTTPTP